MKKRMQKLSVLLALPLTISTMSNTVCASVINEDKVAEASETEENSDTLDEKEDSGVTMPIEVPESDFEKGKFDTEDMINDIEEDNSMSETEENNDTLDEKENPDTTISNEESKPVPEEKNNDIVSEGSEKEISVFSNNSELNILRQPSNYVGQAGDTATFIVEATGDEVSYKWQYSDDGKTWYTSTNTTSTYTTILTNDRNGRQIRCIVTDGNGKSITSETATMSLGTKLEITKQPGNYKGQAGDTATFIVEATGDEVSYKWQYSDDGKTWYTSTNTTSTYTTILTNDRNGRQIRCIVTDGNGKSITSETATMSLGTKLEITKQPGNYKGQAGDTATFIVEATGDEVSYKWQYSDDGKTWYTSTNTTSTYTTILTNDRNGRQIRCIVTDGNGKSITSETVTMSLGTKLEITKQPESYKGQTGDTATFTVEATGKELSYKWQYSDDGKKWYTSANTTSTYTTVLTKERNGRQIRCIVTDGNGKSITSETVTMSLGTKLEITKQPESYKGQAGDTATFTVEATGNELSYKWQYSDDGKKWYTSANTTSTYTTVLTKERDGRQIRCIVTDGNGKSITSETVTMSLGTKLEITKQPESYKGQAGDTATFTVEATGNELSYKWQYSDDGKKWYTSANTTSTYTTVLTKERNGRQIRCIVTDGNGKSITSETVTMSLGTKLEITKQPESYKGQVGDTAIFTVEATGDELSYKWQYSDNGGLTWHDDPTNSKVYETTLTDSNNGRLIRCILADAYGNTLTTNEVSLNIFQAKILSHPENYEGIENDKVTFRVMAEGPGLTYKWQLSDNKGKTWYYSSITANSYTTTLTSSSNGRYVRCIVTDENGHSVTSEIATMTISENFSTGFIYRNGEWRYRYKDGSYANGLTEIEGELYYFVSTVRKTGFYKINDNRYYFDEKTGAAITGLKYVESNGFYYYFQGAGDVYKGLLVTEEGVRYFDTSNGVMQTGKQTVDGTTYYFDLDTGLAVKGFVTDSNGFTFYYDGANGIVSGWQLIEGNKYYFNSKSNELTYGLAKINGIRYYFDPETGILSNGGLINIGESPLKMYINENGIAEKGFITVDENLYYFSETTCLSVTGLQRIGSDTYYFNDEGIAQTGFIEIDNHTYYFGSDYKMVTGVRQIDNKLYYFLENGYMMTGFIRTEDGMAYYFDEDTGAAIDGWYTSSSGYTYYFDQSTYEAVSDWQTIDGKRYYFNPSGVLQTGLIRDNDNKAYYFSKDGSVITGWLDKDGYRYYFDPITQAALTGIQNIDDKIYGFDSNGVMRTGYQNINGSLYYFNTTSGEAMTGFIPFFSSAGTCMVYGDPVSKTLLTGFQTIDGKCYNFRDDGTMRTGMFESNDITYYFDPVTGVAYNGFVLNGDRIFYFSKDGSSVKGCQMIDGNTYVFSSGGTRQTGLAEVDGTRYFLDSNTGISLTGPVKNGTSGYYYAMKEGGGAESETFDYWGTTYYANAGGILRTNSTATVDGQIYYFDEDGERQYGLITYTNSSGKTYTFYFGETSNVTSPSKVEAIQKEMESALSQEGWHEIEGLAYYVENGGFVSGIVNIDGELYGFSETSNVLLSGMNNIGGNYYYLNEQGKVQTGFITDNNTTRYFDPDTGVMAIGFKEINGELYYFLENGAMAKGMFCIEGNIYSASTETNALLTSVGSYNSEGILENDCWKNIDNKTYYIDSYGKRVTGLQRIGEKFYLFSDDGELLTGFIETNGEKRYYGEDGMETGWQEINGDTYYFNTKSGYMETGLLSLDSGVYYLGNDGKKQTGFIEYNGSTYYFDPNTGERKYGLQTIDEKIYYFNESNGIMETGRQTINGKTYYFDKETGERLLGFVNNGVQTVYYDDSELGYAVGLQKIDNSTYLFSENNGAMLTGYRYYNDTMYYFDPQTGASISIIYEIPSGDRYYIKEGGGIHYGLQEIDGKKYYFWPTSGKEVVGLQSIGDKLYYFDKEQGMLKDTTVVVGGLTYILDSNGVASIKDDSKVAQMIRTGMEYLGQPYKEELEDGDMLSCSGYVRLMYNSVGYDNIGDSCFQQWWNTTHNSNYTIIESLDEARAGDLLFYVNLNCTYGEECGFWNEIHHVGIYLGEGKTIEAASYSSEEHPELDCMMVDDVSVDGDIMLYAIVRAIN